MVVKKLLGKYFKVIVGIALFTVIVLIGQLLVALDLHETPVSCQESFGDKIYPKHSCPIGAYCQKEPGKVTGKCLPYLQFFDVRRSPKFIEFKELLK